MRRSDGSAISSILTASTNRKNAAVTLSFDADLLPQPDDTKITNISLRVVRLDLSCQPQVEALQTVFFKSPDCRKNQHAYHLFVVGRNKGHCEGRHYPPNE